VFLDQPALTGKWLELVRQTLPRANQINALWDASSGPWQLAAAKQAAKRLGFEIDTLVVRDESEFARELTDGMDSKPDALVLLSSPLVRARSGQIAEFCTKNRLPAISPFGEFPRAGGLMSYGPNVRDFYLRAAVFVDKVLKGSRAGDQAISVPNQFELVLSPRAAAAMGLTLPPALLAGANEVLG
jgi:putative ABC transport system substrate-binding protein